MSLRSALRWPAFCLALCGATPPARAGQEAVFRPLALSDAPVLPIRPIPGVRYGVEAGVVFKLGRTYHLFTSEMVGDPFAVRMRLAHWVSTDRSNWRRLATLRESSADFSGRDERAALWAPNPIYDARARRWNLFYVAYRAAPNTPSQWRINHDGRIWRAVSTRPGPAGYGGPYRDIGVILQPGRDQDRWEGLQGVDSFYPFRHNGRWYAFYGSAQTQTLPVTRWQVGLAMAPRLSGPWTRLSRVNPVDIEPRFIENPLVSRAPDGRLLALFDTDADDAIGYSFSSDGIHWTPAQHIAVQAPGGWATQVRTPLGLIKEADGTYTLFFTAYRQAGPGEPPSQNPIGSLGWISLRYEGAGKAPDRPTRR